MIGYIFHFILSMTELKWSFFAFQAKKGVLILLFTDTNKASIYHVDTFMIDGTIISPQGGSSDWLKTNPDKFSDLLTSQLLHPRGIQQIQKLLICQAALSKNR